MKIIAVTIFLVFALGTSGQTFQDTLLEAVIRPTEVNPGPHYRHLLVEQYSDDHIEITEYRLWQNAEGVNYRLRNNETGPLTHFAVKGVPSPSIQLFLDKHDLVIKEVEYLLGRPTYRTQIYDSATKDLLQELWIDEATGVRLRNKSYDSSGNLLSRTDYLAFELDPDLSGIDFSRVPIEDSGLRYEPYEKEDLEELFAGLVVPTLIQEEYQLIGIGRNLAEPSLDNPDQIPTQDFALFYHNGRQAITIFLNTVSFEPQVLQGWLFREYRSHELRQVSGGVRLAVGGPLTDEEKLNILWSMIPENN